MKLATETNKNTVLTDHETILAQQKIIEANTLIIAQQDARIRVLEEFLRLEKHKRFSSSSEKYPGRARRAF